ncbi:hypothetical protein [Lawsonibacter celer]|uniref:hypothetical protein n=1 Tax=Lawsonibacter celer TaxID=2986526 RepID=UPI001648F4A2|nr:hypothetical protein [Lawsonibacter celer]
MKRHGSVLMLAARGSLGKALLVCAATAAAELGLFWAALGRAAERAAELAALPPEEAAYRQMENAWSLEQVFTDSRISWVFALGLLALCAILCLNGGGLSGGRTGYTLRRLRVREQTVGVWFAVYGAAVLVIYWAFQTGWALLLCRLYLYRADPAQVNAQTVFLAFYRQAYLHSLLPLAEASRWVRNLALFAGLGTTCACCAAQLRHGGKGVAAAVLAVIGALTFSRETGGFVGDALTMCAAAGLSAWAIWNLREVRRNED